MATRLQTALAATHNRCNWGDPQAQHLSARADVEGRTVVREGMHVCNLLGFGRGSAVPRGRLYI